jgi:hypothetical protein
VFCLYCLYCLYFSSPSYFSHTHYTLHHPIHSLFCSIPFCSLFS